MAFEMADTCHGALSLAILAPVYLNVDASHHDMAPLGRMKR